jgi:hypothetical protein
MWKCKVRHLTRGHGYAGLPNSHVGAYDVRQLPMNPELQRALKRHMLWFGSYKTSGELKKLQVFLVVTNGQIEFLTRGDSYKVKRVRRNPRVICYLGTNVLFNSPENLIHCPTDPTISGTAKIITDPSEVAQVYRKYWKVHPIRMAIVIGLVIWVEMLLNKRVVVRVQPDDPNPLAGLTDPA